MLNPHFNGAIKVTSALGNHFPTSTLLSYLMSKQPAIQAWPRNVQIELTANDNSDVLISAPKSPKAIQTLIAQIPPYQISTDSLLQYVQRVFDTVSAHLEIKPQPSREKIIMDKDIDQVFKSSLKAVGAYLHQAKKQLPQGTQIHFAVSCGPGGRGQAISYSVCAHVNFGDFKDVPLEKPYPTDKEDPLAYVQRIVGQVLLLKNILA